MAPLTLLCERSPPALTIVRPRIHFGVRRSDRFRAMKKASWSWFSACKPCIHGNTCRAEGSGCAACWSRACSSCAAVIEYTGGSLMTFSKPSGGYTIDVSRVGESGVASGVSGCREPGRGPGEQNGMCLFGTAAGVPRCDVLMLRCGGGVAVRLGARVVVVHTAVAIITLVDAAAPCS